MTTGDCPKGGSLLNWLIPSPLASEMHNILKWLVTTDPSPNHSNACQLHESHTGQWLTNSPEYVNWKSGRSQFLWLHGIPGAGKTVLHSYIAEDVAKYCEDNEGFACAFYYCYFAKNQDETDHFLRWVIQQLCRKLGGTLPVGLKEIYQASSAPRRNILFSMLEKIADNFPRVYVTIDALDESVNRENILYFLRHTFENPNMSNIKILATSRKELDIERALSPLGVEFSLSNPYVDEDIRTYVKSRLQEDFKFGRWPESLRKETEAALVKGA